MYASGITYTGVSSVSAGAGAVNGADNGVSLSTVTPGNVVLGQVVGEVGSPARLISAREIPLNTFEIDVLTVGDGFLHITSGQQALNFYRGFTGNQPITISTIQGRAPAPGSTFGNFQIGWLEESFVNPDGQRDAVMSMGYNTNGADGKLNPTEASFATVLESHFQQGGIGNGNFEYYLTTDTIAGTVNRHMFMVVDKITGIAHTDWSIDGQTFSATAANGGLQYAALSPGGLTLTSPTPDISGTTATPGVDGAYKIAPITGSLGTTQFIDESGVSTGFFQFQAACQWLSNRFVNGFATYWFAGTAAAARNRGLVYVNFSFNPGAAIFTVWNDGTVSVYGNSRFGDQGSGTAPTAQVNTSPGTAAAGDGQLKLSPDTALKGAPEQGLFEFDNTAANNLFFTKTATRQNVIVGNNGATAPALTATPIFTSFYGGNTNALGDPVSWLQATINGTVYKIPLYT